MTMKFLIRFILPAAVIIAVIFAVTRSPGTPVTSRSDKAAIPGTIVRMADAMLVRSGDTVAKLGTCADGENVWAISGNHDPAWLEKIHARYPDMTGLVIVTEDQGSGYLIRLKVDGITEDAWLDGQQVLVAIHCS